MDAIYVLYLPMVNVLTFNIDLDCHSVVHGSIINCSSLFKVISLSFIHLEKIPGMLKVLFFGVEHSGNVYHL